MGTDHTLSVGTNNHAVTANTEIVGATYTDITARDADTTFHSNSANVGKTVKILTNPPTYYRLDAITPTWRQTAWPTYQNVAARDADGAFNSVFTNINKDVRVEIPLSYYRLKSTVPTWEGIGQSLTDTFDELTDTPTNKVGSNNKVVQVNSGATALEYGQVLTPLGTPTFITLTISNDLTVDTDTLVVDSSNNQVGINRAVPSVALDVAGNGDNTIPILKIESLGTNGAANRHFNSIVTPIGNITGNPGDICTLVNGTASTEFIHNGASSNNTNWVDMGVGTSGDVVGPVSATDNAIPRFNSATGKIIQDSGILIDDSNSMTGAVNITVSGDVIIGTINVARAPENVVEVYVAADLPNTLVDNTNYVLHAPVTIANGNELTFPSGSDITISTTNIQANKITYTGAGIFFNGTGVIVARIECRIDSSSTGTLCGVTGDGSATSSFLFSGATMFGWDSLGTLTSFGFVGQGASFMLDFDAGLAMVGCIAYGSSQSAWKNSSDQSIDFLTFDSAIERMDVQAVEYSPFPNERIFNINSSANVTAFLTLIQDVATSDRYFNSAGLDSTDPGVICLSCANIADSTTTAELNLIGNTAATIIPAAGALVEINVDVNWTSIGVERLSVGTDGSVDSLGLRAIDLKLDGNVNLEPSTATKSLSMCMVLVLPTTFTITFTNGTNLINETSTTLSDGDNISFRDTAGTLPSELRVDVVYFVVSKLTNSFQLSYTSGGSAIAFTDDGTPVNSYKVATPRGSTPTNTIQSGSPRDLIPQALLPSVLNSTTFLVVINNDDSVNIQVNNGYQRYNA